MMENSEFPLVTVGVASYNNARFIKETLDSIAQQTYPNIELIIHEDGSSDNSVVVIKRWMSENEQINTHLIAFGENVGLCRSLNRIIEKAKGDFISLIGSDDKYLPEFVASRVKAFQSLPDEVGMVYSQTFLIDEESGKRIDEEKRPVWPSGWIFEEILDMKNSFCKPLTSMVRSSVYREVGKYDESLMFEDLDFFLRLSKKFQIVYLNSPQTEYRIVQGSLGARLNSQRGLEDIVAILMKHFGRSVEANRIIESRLQRLIIDRYKQGYKVFNYRKWLLKPFRFKPFLLFVVLSFNSFFMWLIGPIDTNEK